jgi:DNA repair exonuclease SbcCD ATPase subunit
MAVGAGRCLYASATGKNSRGVQMAHDHARQRMKRLLNVVAAEVAIVTLFFAAPSSSLIGMYVRAPIAAYLTQYADRHDTAVIEGREFRLRDAAATAPQSQEPDREKTSALLQDLAAARQELTANEAQYRKALAEERDRSAALTSELATAQRNVETQVGRSNETANEAAQLRKAADAAASELQRERERAEALAGELAKVRREVEAAAAVSSQKDDEAVQQKQTAEATIADLQQLLQREQKKTAALTQEVGAARQAMTASAEQQRRALDEVLAGIGREIETQAAQSQKAIDEVVQQKQTAEATIADLQQLLQREQKKTAALTQEVGAARQAMTASAEQQRRALDEVLAGTGREIETQGRAVAKGN